MTDGSVIEAAFSLRDQEGNVLTDFLLTPSTVGNTAGNWHRLSDHVFLGRRPLVHRTSPTSGQITYTTVVTDHLQSTRKEISNLDNPAAQSTFTYWPFGEFAERLGTPAAKHLYTAHEREDTGTEAGTMGGLDYMHARYYSPLFGRLASIDQLGGDVGNAGKWNRYAYAHNCPLTYLDPDGRNPVASDQAIRIIKEIRAQTYWRLMDVPVVGTALAAAFDTLVTAFPSNDAIAIDLVPVPAVVTSGSNQAAVALLRKNAKQGAAFERKVVQELKQFLTDVVEQVTVKTKSGVKTRLDIVGKEVESGALKLTEAKSSATARFTINPKMAFPEIKESGALVVGKGKPGVPGGTEIPPTIVDIVRPE